jgi:hypothetical protein
MWLQPPTARTGLPAVLRCSSGCKGCGPKKRTSTEPCTRHSTIGKARTAAPTPTTTQACLGHFRVAPKLRDADLQRTAGPDRQADHFPLKGRQRHISLLLNLLVGLAREKLDADDAQPAGACTNA